MSGFNPHTHIISSARPFSPQIRSNLDTERYLALLLEERRKLEPFLPVLPICGHLLDQEIARVSGMPAIRGGGVFVLPNQVILGPLTSTNLISNNGRTDFLSQEGLGSPQVARMHASPKEMYIRKFCRVDVPADKYPNFNFVAHILGPNGNTLRGFEKQTGCRLFIRGKGSLQDPEKEKKLRQLTGDEHLDEPLHLLIQADFGADVVDIKLWQARDIVEKMLNPPADLQDHLQRQQIQEPASSNDPPFGSGEVEH